MTYGDTLNKSHNEPQPQSNKRSRQQSLKLFKADIPLSSYSS